MFYISTYYYVYYFDLYKMNKTHAYEKIIRRAREKATYWEINFITCMKKHRIYYLH